jgi:hypothetical protein
MKPLALTLTAAVALLLTGCQHGAYYKITPLFPDEPTSGTGVVGTEGAAIAQSVRNRLEVIPDRLDGHWFERRIYAAGSGTTPEAIELMYCPILKDGATVCRTTTIWSKGVTNLLEGDSPAH